MMTCPLADITQTSEASLNPESAKGGGAPTILPHVYKIPINTITVAINIKTFCILIFRLIFSLKIHYISDQSGKSPDGNTPNNYLSTGKRKEQGRESRSELDFKTMQVGSKLQRTCRSSQNV